MDTRSSEPRDAAAPKKKKAHFPLWSVDVPSWPLPLHCQPAAGTELVGTGAGAVMVTTWVIVANVAGAVKIDVIVFVTTTFVVVAACCSSSDRAEESGG